MQLKSRHARMGLAFAAVLLAVPAMAALRDRGPVDPVTGFPVWYRDNGIPATATAPAVPSQALELCLAQTPSPNAAAGGAPMCFPWGPNPDGFPGNFGDEQFWAVGDAIAAGGFGEVRLVTALEAAYATGTPVRGQEISFARIRIILDANLAGTYTVVHPFGVEIFPNVAAGARAVTFTSDIGATGIQFDGALAGAVGPFLRWDVLNAGETLTVLNNTTGQLEEYLGDPNIQHTVTGSPFGTNYLQVIDPSGAVTTQPLFTVVGKKYTTPIATPLSVQRATYRRTTAFASLDVFAQANAGQQLVLADSNTAAPAIVPTIMAANASSYLGHVVVGSTDILPQTVTVTNTTDVPANVVTANVVDMVTILDAIYDPATSILTVQAVSSDELAPPALTAAGFGAVDAAGATFAAGLVPPESITVSSSAGGSASRPVRVAQTTAAGGGSTSVANNDVGVLVTFNTPATIDVVANDVVAATPALAAVVVTAPAAHGTVAPGATLGTLVYTPALNYFGPDSFAYVLRDAAGQLSNVASVTLTVSFVPTAPVANNDLITTTAGVPNTSAILANDTASFNTTLVPASVVLSALTPAAAGTITFSAATGLVTFTPAAGFSGAASATYTVSNNFGQASNAATISIQVNANPEVINITRAQFRTGTSRWTVTGTSTVATGTVTIYNGTTVAAPVIGTAPIVAGAFAFDLVGGPPPNPTRLILIRSTNGGQRIAAVTVRN